MAVDVETIWRCYQQLSDGDKSCVQQMISHKGGQQLTSVKSPHSQFYQLLQQSELAQPGEIEPELSKHGIQAWVLNDNGRANLAICLTAGKAKASLHAEERRIIFGSSVRFCAGYAAVQTLGGVSAFNLAKQGIDLTSVPLPTLVLLYLFACFVGLRFCIKEGEPEHPAQKIYQLERLHFVIGRSKRLCVAFAFACFPFHLLVEFLREYYFLGTTSYGPVVRSVIAAIFAGIFSYVLIGLVAKQAHSGILRDPA